MSTPPARQTLLAPDRHRVTFDVSPSLSLLLDHVCEVTGATKSQVVMQALIDALPALLERSDGLQKRANSLQQSQQQKRK